MLARGRGDPQRDRRSHVDEAAHLSHSLAALALARRRARRSPPRGARRARTRCAPPPGRPRRAPRVTLSAAQQRYLGARRRPASRVPSSAGAIARRGWYDARLDDRERYPLATIWDIVPLFESLDAIAIAAPDAARHAARVARFADGAERYLNRGLRPLPGYSPYPGDREATPRPGSTTTAGGASRSSTPTARPARAATCRRRTRRCATSPPPAGTARAGGIWWNTDHPYKAGAALASDTLLATLIYQQTALERSRSRRRTGSSRGRTPAASAPPTACTPAATSTRRRSTTSRRR